MAAFALLVVSFHALFASLAAAQTTDGQPGETVWASVAYIVAGEHTPVLGPWNTVLTPEGAQQMLRQGRAFRTRYLLLEDEDEFPEYAAMARARIRDMSSIAIDNSQLSIYAGTNAYMATSALAFMQGLYPALAQAFPANHGGITMSIDTATDGTTDYPLDGYQYPAVRAIGVSDEEAVYIQGHAGCAAWTNFTDVYTKAENLERYAEFDGAFKALFARKVLRATLEDSDVNFWNAHAIYDYVDYMYRHNKTVFGQLSEWPSGLRQEFANYALLEQLAKNSDGEVSNSRTGEQDRLIPGRTLAHQVLSSFRKSIAAESAEDRMTLMFGSAEPVMAFARLARVRKTSENSEENSNSNSNPTSAFLPQPGSAIVFELFAEGPALSQPGDGHLRVRVLFRPGPAVSDDFETQAIFFDTNGTSNTMSYAEFVQDIQHIGYDVAAWCEACGSPTPFCRGRQASSSGPTTGGDSPLEDAILETARRRRVVKYGVIGVLATLAFVVLAAFTIFVCCAGPGVCRAMRLSWPAPAMFPRRKRDADVVVARDGTRSERVGSWELRDGGVAQWPARTAEAGATAKDKDRAEAGGVGGVLKTTGIETLSRWKDAEDDAVSDLGVEPTKPRSMV